MTKHILEKISFIANSHLKKLNLNNEEIHVQKILKKFPKIFTELETHLFLKVNCRPISND